MKKGLVGCGVVIVLVLLVTLAVFGWFVRLRNGLVAAEETVKEAWSQVENVYQRRLDLIPNLVETVKGYAAHERETLQAVTEARSRVAGTQPAAGQGAVIDDPQAFGRFQEAQAGLGAALSRLLVVVERYPDLKANQSFLALQSQLEGTENRIAVERRRYNEVARDFNTRIRQFPASIVASFSGFKEKAYFESAPGAEKAPEVKF